MSTASRDTLLQVFQDKTNRTLKPVVDKIINHSTKGYGFHERFMVNHLMSMVLASGARLSRTIIVQCRGVDQ